MGSRALTDELSLNKSIDGDNDEYNDQSQRHRLKLGSRGPRTQSEQKLMKTNFLSQLKSLQEMLKESMLDAIMPGNEDGGDGSASDQGSQNL